MNDGLGPTPVWIAESSAPRDGHQDLVAPLIDEGDEGALDCLWKVVADARRMRDSYADMDRCAVGSPTTVYVIPDVARSWSKPTGSGSVTTPPTGSVASAL